jgi:hypothetical protein
LDSFGCGYLVTATLSTGNNLFINWQQNLTNFSAQARSNVVSNIIFKNLIFQNQALINLDKYEECSRITPDSDELKMPNILRERRFIFQKNLN